MSSGGLEKKFRDFLGKTKTWSLEAPIEWCLQPTNPFTNTFVVNRLMFLLDFVLREMERSVSEVLIQQKLGVDIMQSTRYHNNHKENLLESVIKRIDRLRREINITAEIAELIVHHLRVQGVSQKQIDKVL